MNGNSKEVAKFGGFRLDAQRDPIDFRDKIYVPTLVEVPLFIPLEKYKEQKVPILNQGQEGSCTGFGLATVAHSLLRRRVVVPDEQEISPRMIYAMARRYDEFPGERYSGSSARGAMKGWNKHGVCSKDLWPYEAGKEDNTLSNDRAVDALKRPLGAYFRVNHRDIVSMHSALAEVGVLYATATVHDGWGKIDKDGVIYFEPGIRKRGGHAFAIVAFDQRGFWIQNSWGEGWGKAGFALITYDDWLEHATDVWVARLGVPIYLKTADATAITVSPGSKQVQYSFSELRPHVISLQNDGQLSSAGTYGATEEEVEEIIKQDIPRIMEVVEAWDKKRILLYAHGGLVSEKSIIQRLAELRVSMMQNKVYPLAFVWHTDYWSTVTNILKEAFQTRRPDGALSDALDFMLDRLDETLENVVRAMHVRMLWDEMKENAYLATISPTGGVRIFLKYLAELMEEDPSVEVHLAGHSAGSIFLAPLAQLLTTAGKIDEGPLKGKTGYGLPVSSCTLWAPGISIDEFKQTYLPSIQSGQLQRFALYTLSDKAEQKDNVAGIYHKSLLYLVSNALEDHYGTPLLGLEKDVKKDSQLQELFKSGAADWVKAPNNSRLGSILSSKATRHGDFDDDEPTLRSTLARILAVEQTEMAFSFSRSGSSLSDRRKMLEAV